MTLAALVVLGLNFALGAALTSLLRCAPAARFARAPFAYLVGALAAAVVAAGAVALRARALEPLVVTTLVAVAASVAVGRRRSRALESGTPPPEAAATGGGSRAIRCAAGAVVGVLCLASAARATFWNYGPVLDGDEAEIWAAKAHAFELVRAGSGVTDALLDAGVAHPDYPPLNPLLQILVYDAAGGVSPYTARWPMQACGVLLLAAVYGLAAARGGPRAGPVVGLVAALGVFACAWHEGMCRQGMSDGLAAFGLLFAAEGVVAWLEDRDRGAARRAAIALAFLVASKNEGLLLAAGLLGAAGVVLLARRPANVGRAALGLLPAATAAAAVWLWNARFDLQNDVTSEGEGFGPRVVAGLGSDRLGIVATYFFKTLALDPRSGTATTLLAGLAAPFLLLLRRRPAALGAAAAAAFAAFFGYALVFVGTPRELDWHLATAAGRIVAQAAPTASWVLAALLLARPRATAP